MARKPSKPVAVDEHEKLTFSAATGALGLQRGKMPVTINKAKGQAQGATQWLLANEIKDWRAWAGTLMIGSRGQTLVTLKPPVEVTVFHLRKNRAAVPDTGAPMFAVKAILDGLVDAGALPDDGPEYVRRLIFEAPRITGFQGLRISVQPLHGEPLGLVDETKSEGLF